MGLFNLVKGEFSWYITNDGWFDGFITASRVGGLDQFVRDRTTPVGMPMAWSQVQLPAGYLNVMVLHLIEITFLNWPLHIHMAFYQICEVISF